MTALKFANPAERLIVSADYKPDLNLGQGLHFVEDQVCQLAHKL